MLLAIDIGNSNISFGIFKGNSIIKTFDLPSKQYSINKFRKKIGSLKITDIIICSVVPKLTSTITKDLARTPAKRSYILGKDLRVPIKNLYRSPSQVGQDRLVNAYAGLIFYGAPLIIIDSGTAITFDVISKHKAYLGGLILPGLGISLAALNEKTALLPPVKLKYPQELIGRDTISSILSGVIIGAGALANGLTNKIKRKIGKNTCIIGTGGNIELIKKYADLKIKIDRNLTLKGINLIYNNEIKNPPQQKKLKGIFKLFIIIVCFFYILGVKNSFCEEQELTEGKNEAARMAHEQALKNYDTQKQKEQEKLTTTLNARLGQVTENWIATAKKDKESKLNTRLEQQWEKLALSFPVSPVPYAYDLRGYKYSVVKSDVNKTDSLTFPYKALVIIKEELYVERNHSPDISNVNPYFFTVNTNYTLNLEYRNEKFDLISSDSKIVAIENDCPNEIKRKRL